MKIAVIGSGITGLSAAWLLGQNHDVSVFESSDRIGGHATTIEISGHPAIDIGFAVSNKATSPNLLALLEYFNVPTVKSHVNFGVSLMQKNYEYAGNVPFPKFSYFFKPSHLRMIYDIRRFHKAVSHDQQQDHETLKSFLTRHNYSNSFTYKYIYPLVSSIWNVPSRHIGAFPMADMSHCFNNFNLRHDNPKKCGDWLTVMGGSRAYIDALSNLKGQIYLNAKVRDVIRHKDFVEIVREGGKTEQFEQVVLAVHSDQALNMLSRPTLQEKSVLEAFPYQHNKVYLHQDERLMPKNKKMWSGYNYIDNDMGHGGSQKGSHDPYVTMWMNKLQPFIDRGEDYFVSVNPAFLPDNILHEANYAQPYFHIKSSEKRREIAAIQGINRTWFCGSWCGYGFHEDGLSAGLSLAESLGGHTRPWIVTEKSPAGDHCTPLYE